MADTASFPNFTAVDMPDRMSVDQAMANRFTQAALERHKREGLLLAMRARWAALGVIAVLIVFLNPAWEMLYYHVMLAVSAFIGWLQTRVGQVGRSGPELAVLFCDLAVLTFVLSVPSPFTSFEWPNAMYFRFENFAYMYVILATATLSYSWRTIIAVGTWTAGMWALSIGIQWWFSTPDPSLAAAAQAAFGHDPAMLQLLDPNGYNFDIRTQNIVIFIIVAVTLGVSIRRFNRLILGNASLERERENLSRYFSPNVVDELSHNDEPLKQIRSHDAAIMFVDIIGFTRFAAHRSPEDVIGTLRDFHGRMENAVFAYGGTLDKFLGDGLMASFGTPVPGDHDALRAWNCAQAMAQSANDWNAARAAEGEPELAVSIGVHLGPVVLGDIGGNRLEFAVIGNTVNIASRMEGLTRPLGCDIVISDEMYQALSREDTTSLVRFDDQQIAGLDHAVTVWARPRETAVSTHPSPGSD